MFMPDNRIVACAALAMFAIAVGFGTPFAGALAMVMFSLAIMAKLLSETVDAIDPGPLEAADAAGASHWEMVRYAAYPQVSPNYVAYALYIFELNIRASVVIGIVGAGGIGRLLDERRNLFQWDEVMAIRVSLLMNSVDGASSVEADYTYFPSGSTAVSPSSGDYRLRQEFSSLISVRNAVF